MVSGLILKSIISVVKVDFDNKAADIKDNSTFHSVIQTKGLKLE